MNYCDLFSTLNVVDSSNNYAMRQAHEGLAKHGMAWFARLQTNGKGQRGKEWLSNAGENIILSIIIQPAPNSRPHDFNFNALIAITIVHFLIENGISSSAIKWPNDLYWRDRKAGGILIENVIRGNSWNWCVIGVGINTNQESFNPDLPNPISMYQITGKTFNAEELSRKLHLAIMEAVDGFTPGENLMEEYNRILYKKGETVKLKKDNAVFETTILSVDEHGRLHTKDVIERTFIFGDVAFII